MHEVREERHEILAIHTPPQCRCRMRKGVDRHVGHNTIGMCAGRESRLQPLFQQRSASPNELQVTHFHNCAPERPWLEVMSRKSAKSALQNE